MPEEPLTPDDMRLHNIPMYLFGADPQALKEFRYPEMAHWSWAKIHEWKILRSNEL
jgi:hypothetical protein